MKLKYKQGTVRNVEKYIKYKYFKKWANDIRDMNTRQSRQILSLFTRHSGLKCYMYKTQDNSNLCKRT